MGTIKKILDNALRAEASFDSDLIEIIEDSKQEIIDLNMEDQLFKKSEDSEGNKIGVYAHTYLPEPGQSTKGYPKRKGKPYNLHDFGDFSALFKVNRLSPSKLRIFNKDPKLKEIFKNTGDKIIGLQEENKSRVNIKIILPKLRAKVVRNFQK